MTETELTVLYVNSDTYSEVNNGVQFGNQIVQRIKTDSNTDCLNWVNLEVPRLDPRLNLQKHKYRKTRFT